MKRRVTSYSLILIFGLLYSTLSFALITSSDDVASRYELVGIISSNVVVLKDKQTGSSLTRRLGEPLSQELKISKIDSNSITLTSSAIGEDFVLTFDKFGTTVATNTPAPTKVPATPTIKTTPTKTPVQTPKSSPANELSTDKLSSANIVSSQPPVDTNSNLPPPSVETAAAEEVPTVSELSPETLDMLDKFYEDPDSFSTEQIKELEKRLLEGK